MKRTLSGTVTGLKATRNFKLRGQSVSAGTVLSPAWLRGVRVDVLVAKGLLKIVPDQLPLRRNKHPRPFHVTPGDWKSING